MKTKLALLALVTLCLSSFTLSAAAPDQVAVSLTAEDKLGLTHVTAQHNAEAKAKHDAEQAAKPEAERVAYVPLTEEQYAKLRFADVFKSWTEVYMQYRMSLPENVEFFKKATLLTEEQKAQLKALIDGAAPAQ